MSFVHLHTHTEYSLLDGSNKISEYVSTVKKLGMTAAAITDHGAMYGVVEFYRACKEAGINPVIGSEIYVANGSRFQKESKDSESRYYHLILLAENNTGYSNLIKIVSSGFVEGFYYRPRVDYEVLEKYHEGLICLSACVAGEVPKALLSDDYDKALKVAQKHISIFGKDNYFLELQDHGLPVQKKVNAGLMRLSKELDIPLVATNDCHYTLAEDADAHDALICIQTGAKLKDDNRMRYEGGNYYVKSEDEMRTLFPYAPQAIDNTQKIADRCRVEFEFGRSKYPKYEPKDGMDNYDFLKDLCQKGIKEKYPNASEEKKKEINTRLEYELGVIKNMGFVDYFLIVWDFINYAKSTGIPVGPGRGSAAGSIVSYATGITDIDPLKYDLLFERFLNPERVSMPDIDVDFCPQRRGEVINYVTDKYGKDRVSQIITFNTLKAKAAIKDVGRVMDLPFKSVAEIAATVPGEIGITINKALSQNPDLARKYAESKDTKELIDLARRLEGLPRHLSIHAAGVVISGVPLTDVVPLASSDGQVMTEFTMTTLEELGLLKMDFLGLRNLTVIKDCLELIEKDSGEKIDFHNMEYNDKAVFNMISAGKNDGVFQLESAGMTSFMTQLKPENIEDVIAGIALYRPGPMDFIPKYIKGKNNKDTIVYDCPQLEPILKNTYGCIVYQEQVMQIVQNLAGFSLGKSDNLRRAMSKKKQEVMVREKEVFLHGDEQAGIPGCVKNGIEEKVASKIYDDMLDFAKYAFNKSHAASYAMLSYQTAYLKCHYPREFYASLLTSEINSPGKITRYVTAAREAGIEVLLPDVNTSYGMFTVNEGRIIYGLYAIKNVGQNISETIVSERELRGPYRDIEDFLHRVIDYTQANNAGSVSKKSIESLIYAGALDCLPGNRRQKLSVYSIIMDRKSREKSGKIAGQVSLFDMISPEEKQAFKPQLTPMEEFDKEELLSNEKRVLGVYISGHILDDYKEIIRYYVTATSDMFAPDISQKDYDEIMDYVDNEEVENNKTYVVGGMISSVNMKYTKKGEPMAFVNIEDLKGQLEVIVFPKVYDMYREALFEENKVLVRGRASVDGERGAKLICEDITEFSKVKNSLYVRFENRNEFLQKQEILNNLFAGKSGDVSLIICLSEDKSRAKMKRTVAVDDILLKQLEDTFGESNVIYTNFDRV